MTDKKLKRGSSGSINDNNDEIPNIIQPSPPKIVRTKDTRPKQSSAIDLQDRDIFRVGPIELKDQNGNIINPEQMDEFLPPPNQDGFDDIFDSPKSVKIQPSLVASSFFSPLSSAGKFLKSSKNVFKAGFGMTIAGLGIAATGLFFCKTGVGATVGAPMMVAGICLALAGVALMSISMGMEIRETQKQLDKNLSLFDCLAPRWLRNIVHGVDDMVHGPKLR